METDRLLSRLGFQTDDQLLDRWQAISSVSPLASELKNRVRKIIIPSRVSVGSDVVITSILLCRLLDYFPGADFILLGPRHLGEIFHDLDRVNHLLFEVNRYGNIFDRTLFWPAVYKIVSEEINGTDRDSIIIFDPDSRLTQLGLLPLAPDIKTCHFPSRSMPAAPDSPSLSSLTNNWLNRLLGSATVQYPKIKIASTKLEKAKVFCDKLKTAGCRRLILINLGVGDDERKRLPALCETGLLNRLLNLANTIIILDMGCGSEEKGRGEKVIASLAGTGHKTVTINEQEIPRYEIAFCHGILGISTSIGTLAALISQADCYIGYDSSGQHLANALEIPTISIFKGYPNERFIERWTPFSRSGLTTVIPVTDDMIDENDNCMEIIDKTCSAVDTLINENRP